MAEQRENALSAEDSGGPVLVSTNVTYCVTHGATDHDGKKWTACRFRQLFYFEDPMDEHTIAWADEIGAPPSWQAVVTWLRIYQVGGWLALAHVLLGTLLGSMWVVGFGGGAAAMWLLSQAAIRAATSANGRSDFCGCARRGHSEGDHPPRYPSPHGRGSDDG